MLWGSFGTVHILSLVLGAGLIVGLYFLLRCFSAKIQTIVLGVLSFAGIAAIVFNLVTWGSPYEYLPLHLCSLTAMVLPVAVVTRSKVLSNLLLLWSLGAVMALVVNTAQANFEILSPTFFFYFFPHLLEFGIPILLFRLGLVEKDIKCIVSTLLITLCVFTLIHFANVALNSYFVANQILNPAGEVIQVNYMYSIKPENPVLALFWSLIPAAYWYMLPVMLIVLIYLAAVYAKQIIRYFKAKKR
ncbi:MAG: YwaF family protein [Oscillospiraceae bacterium]|nr:YwaF family protein [Oscillospiraceae bacterium]